MDALPGVADTERLQHWLRETQQLDVSHPKVRITAHKLTQSRQTLPARAAAIHNFVRRLPYNARLGTSTLRASDVLRQGCGDAYSKAILFVALCRAADLPARLLFLSVRPHFLQGLLRRRPAAVPHIVAQVLLDGEWRSTDGYVVDPILFAQAKQRLRQQELDSGWGIVRDADALWDGHGDCLHQIRPQDICVAYGVFHDLRHFRRAGVFRSCTWFAWRVWSAWPMNRRLGSLRRWGPHAAA